MSNVLIFCVAALDKPGSREQVSSPNLFSNNFRPVFAKTHTPYRRQASSISQANEAFDVIVGAQKEKVHSIEKGATADDDLLMISKEQHKLN